MKHITLYIKWNCQLFLSYDLKSFSSLFGSLWFESCGCFSQYNLQSFNRCFLFSCVILLLSTSHNFFRSSFSSFWIQFRLCRFTVLFYFLSSEIRIFLYDIHSNACSEVMLQGLRSFFQKKIIFVSEKKESCKTVSGLISRSQLQVFN